MPMPDIFDPVVTASIVERIEHLTPESSPLWGTMSVDQMLAHANVTYELVFEPEKHPEPTGIQKYFLRWLVKPKVVNEEAYKPNLPTGPQFLINNPKNFEYEKQRIITHIQKVQLLGRSHFEGKQSHSFGRLNAQQWNNMFFKHIDHHLRQFGV